MMASLVAPINKVSVPNTVESLDPRGDLVFKKLFGTIENKDLLIAFINSILKPEDQEIKMVSTII